MGLAPDGELLAAGVAGGVEAGQAAALADLLLDEVLVDRHLEGFLGHLVGQVLRHDDDTLAVADEAFEMTIYEDFVEEKVREGRRLPGLYPASDASREEFKVWRKAQGR